MKKPFLVILSTIIVICSSFADSDFYKTNGITQLGARIGLNRSSLWINDELWNGTYGNRYNAINIGGIIVYSISNYFAVKTELILSPKGGMVVLEDENCYCCDGRIITINADLFYIEIPVLIRYTPIRSEGGNSFNLYAGPSMGYNIYNEVLVEEEIINGCPDDENGINLFYRYYNIELNFGIGYEYDFGKGSIIVDVRYSFGMMPSIESDDLLWDLYNDVYSINLSYAFNLREKQKECQTIGAQSED